MADKIDLSLLPDPELILVDGEKNLAERLVDLQARYEEVGIEWDEQDSELDSGVIVQQVNNYRETLALLQLNAAYIKTLISRSKGPALDQIAANLHFMKRMDGESDARFLERIQYESENKAGGRLAGYKVEAMNTSIDIVGVGGLIDRSIAYEPVVRIAIMADNVQAWAEDPNPPARSIRFTRSGPGNGTPSTDLLLAAQARLERDDIAQATDVIFAQPIDVIEYTIDLTIFIRPGPDASLIRRTGANGAIALASERNRPGRDVPLSSIIAASTAPGSERVRVDSPVADIFCSELQVATCTAITIRTELTNG